MCQGHCQWDCHSQPCSRDSTVHAHGAGLGSPLSRHRLSSPGCQCQLTREVVGCKVRLLHHSPLSGPC